MGAYEVVEELERLRKELFLRAAMMFICLFGTIFVLVLGSWLNIDGFTAVIVVLLFIVTIWLGKRAADVNKQYQILYKRTFVISVLSEIFQDVKYQWEKGFNRTHIKKFGLVKSGNTVSSEDYISASYKGIHFEQADVIVQNERGSGKNSKKDTYFRGRMFTFDFPAKQVVSVQVFSKLFLYRANPEEGFHMNKVSLESEQFNKHFDVYAMQEHDAFYVLTPAMMERIEQIQSRYFSMAMHFHGKKLYMALNLRGNAFEGKIMRRINYMDEKMAVQRDVQVIVDIIDTIGMMQDGND